MPTIHISDFDLDDDERIMQESATICNIEFDKQDEYFEHTLGKKVDAKVVSKPYLTNKRLLLWMLIVPEKLDPKMFWYSLPLENINYMRPNKSGKHADGKKGIEIEFATPKVGGASVSLGKKLGTEGVSGWIGHKMLQEKTKLWLYVPDHPLWNIQITKVLQSMGKVA